MGPVSAHIRRNLWGIVALFVALGGTATALPGKNQVDSGDIGKAQVKSSDLANAAVINPKLAVDAVDGSKVVDNSLKGADVDESSLNLPSVPAALPPNGAAGGDLSGQYPTPQVEESGLVPGGDLGGTLAAAQVQESGLTVGGDLQGTVAAAQVSEAGLNAGGDLGGTLANAQIGSGAVSDAEIANGTTTVTIPASSIGATSVGGSGQPTAGNFVGFPAVVFGSVSDSTLELVLTVPDQVAAGNLSAKILQSAGASGRAVWDLALDRVRPESLDFVSTTTSVLSVDNRFGDQFAGEVEAVTFGPASTSTVEGGDLIRLRLTRDANDANDGLADATRIFAIEVTFPTVR